MSCLSLFYAAQSLQIRLVHSIPMKILKIKQMWDVFIIAQYITKGMMITEKLSAWKPSSKNPIKCNWFYKCWLVKHESAKPAYF